MAEQDDKDRTQDPKTGIEAAQTGNERVQEQMDVATSQGFFGAKTDPTPNENYTVAGVTKDAPTPENDPEAALRARVPDLVGQVPALAEVIDAPDDDTPDEPVPAGGEHLSGTEKPQEAPEAPDTTGTGVQGSTSEQGSSTGAPGETTGS